MENRNYAQRILFFSHPFLFKKKVENIAGHIHEMRPTRLHTRKRDCAFEERCVKVSQLLYFTLIVILVLFFFVMMWICITGLQKRNNHTNFRDMGAGAGKEAEQQQTNNNNVNNKAEHGGKTGTPTTKQSHPSEGQQHSPISPRQQQHDACPGSPLSPQVSSLIAHSTMDDLLGVAGSNAKYIKKDMIGKGAFGEAFIVERASDKREFVAKLMDLRSMSPKDKRYAQTEILCLAHSDHFAIVHYIEHCVVDEDTVVIVMEFADHGDLYNNIRKGSLHLAEREAGVYFVQLLLALDHIHRRRMIHRDIKSANVFMTSAGLLKLGDFGFSQKYDQTVSNPIATTFLGTPYYLAPEMWDGKRYGKKADMWAVGIVLFELLTTKRPFVASNMTDLRTKVLAGNFLIPDTLSRDMQDLIRRILVLDPVKRLSAQEALRTPLMQHYLVLLDRHLSESTSIAEDVRELVKKNIDDAQTAIKDAIAIEEAMGVAVHYEGTVYKESESGWKERYLILGDGKLTLTLARGKEAAAKSDRSKEISLETILSAVPVAGPEGSSKWVFAISTTTSAAIVMACKAQSERDEWVTKILSALEMN